MTDEPLKPIPAPTTTSEDPNGHYEIPEPNFTVTRPCRDCSPVIEISVTGFDDWPSTPVAQHQSTLPSLPLVLPSPPSLAPTQSGPSPLPPTKATITAGPSQLVISKESTGNGFIIADSTGGPSATVTPGQTITVDKTPIVIQTSSSSTAILIITNPTLTLTIPLTQMPTPMPYAAHPSSQQSGPLPAMNSSLIPSITPVPIVTTAVMVTRATSGSGGGELYTGSSVGGGRALPAPTGGSGAGIARVSGAWGWLESIVLLGVMGLGWLGVGL